MSTGGKWKYKTAKDLEVAVEEYISSCKPEMLVDRDGNVVRNPNGQPVWVRKPPTMTGLALALGFKDRISMYEQEKRGGAFAKVISRAKSLIEEHHEARLSEPGCTGSIFFLKNHGWVDEQFFSGGSMPIGVASMALTPEEEARYKANMARFFPDVKLQ